MNRLSVCGLVKMAAFPRQEVSAFVKVLLRVREMLVHLSAVDDVQNLVPVANSKNRHFRVSLLDPVLAETESSLRVILVEDRVGILLSV